LNQGKLAKSSESRQVALIADGRFLEISKPSRSIDWLIGWLIGWSIVTIMTKVDDQPLN
jgi:hypothetical protein